MSVTSMPRDIASVLISLPKQTHVADSTGGMNTGMVIEFIATSIFDLDNHWVSKVITGLISLVIKSRQVD